MDYLDFSDLMRSNGQGVCADVGPTRTGSDMATFITQLRVKGKLCLSGRNQQWLLIRSGGQIGI